ncbi:GDP-fucose protein O-fucosyltransferase [Seminavis robusta]|uniref:GDP-fucose protein O-fucosyltransferase n=1 Tax=Seminavis robusta TaxID=568900 RepID=A0A9N8EX58_9STRA|nr:GDP-fucose protein O-fucosyltransferase [Seminavis robusta]|eukprot:Sro2020_g311380.1 GDP-fucose protein O-fucosyltransferase (572) ;mRNA; r:14201-16050
MPYIKKTSHNVCKGSGRCAKLCFLPLIILFGCTALVFDLANLGRGVKVQQEQEMQHKLAGLNCDAYGGPSEEVAQELVYWEDIPSDATYVSPFKKRNEGPKQYLTFEPDGGGWNNVRMNMETVLAMAYAMGRTLVLPPEQEFYLLGARKGKNGDSQQRQFSFNDFFHMESIRNEHPGLDIITMKEFLEQEAMAGNLRNQQNGSVVFPPQNQTDWNGVGRRPRGPLWEFLRSTTGHVAIWKPEECMAAFPTSPDPQATQRLWDIKQQVEQEHEGSFPMPSAYIGKPVPVNASAKERMMENWSRRKTLCLYDNTLQNTQFIHFPSDYRLGARLLVHFYAFLFFEDWQQDLHMKRFVRDHVRYVDRIQCAAARVIEALRERARNNPAVAGQNPKGEYDAFHIRRGDFQYKVTRVDARQIYEVSKSKLQEGQTIYIATEERDKKGFFQPLREKYDIVFLDDFRDVLGDDFNTNFDGMVDQLVASRSRTFFGCWFSAFTAYINRLRGYHSTHERAPGYEEGIHNSWYYAPEDRYDQMQTYYPILNYNPGHAYIEREFPTSWRLIDTGIGDLPAQVE